MGNEKKKNLSEEHLREFKYRVNYVVNETPKYRSLVGTNEEFDEVPAVTNEAGEQEDAEKLGGMTPPEPSNDQPISMDDAGMPPEDPAAAPAPEPSALPPQGAPEDPMGDPMGAPAEDPAMAADPMAAPPAQPDNQVDELQNEIIKLNIQTMRTINDKLANMDANFAAMNAKMEALNANVEEVREPTDSEKLMNKTSVSYPYYFNLNDFWKDNWFDQQRAEGQEQGIKELPDGTYVADFDDLPQQSKIDIDNSFNDI